MLEIHIKPRRFINDETLEIFEIPKCTLLLEHSLISLHRWEQKWKIPYLNDDDKTDEQTLDYIRCMTINKVDDICYYGITTAQMNEIIEYIHDEKTAAWFSNVNKLIGAQKTSGEKVTAETIYYWMITLGIPMEFQKWHLSSLLTLIKFVSLKNQKPKKMSERDASAQRRAINAKRRAKYKTKG